MSLRPPFYNRFSSTRSQGAGGIFEEQSDRVSHHSSQNESEYPATAEGAPPGSNAPAADNGSDHTGAPLVVPATYGNQASTGPATYGNQNPAGPATYGNQEPAGPSTYGNQNPAGPPELEAGYDGDGPERKKRIIPLWAKWCCGILLLIIIILAIVLGAVLGTRHHHKGYTGTLQPVESGSSVASSTSPAGVLASSSLSSVASSVGISASGASTTTSPVGGPSASDSPSGVVSSPGPSASDSPGTTAYPAGPSSSGSPDTESSVVVSPSDSVGASGGYSDGAGPTPTHSTGYQPCYQTTTRKTTRPTPTYGYGYGKVEPDQKRHYCVYAL